MKNQFIVTPFFMGQYAAGLEELVRPGWAINHPVNLPRGTQPRRMIAYQQPLADFTASCAARGDRPVSIAGDCCSAIAFLAGLQRAGLDPTLVWLDAHGDFNTWETTPSGFLGGMPLAMLVGRGEQTFVEAVKLRLIPESQVILCDGRDLDPMEGQAMAASRVTHLADIHSLPGHPLLERPVYIHLDTDVINPNDAPAMTYLAPGGPSAAEVRSVFQALAASRECQIVGVSMSAWNPELDTDKRSQAVCLELLETLLTDG